MQFRPELAAQVAQGDLEKVWGQPWCPKLVFWAVTALCLGGRSRAGASRHHHPGKVSKPIARLQRRTLRAPLPRIWMDNRGYRILKHSGDDPKQGGGQNLSCSYQGELRSCLSLCIATSNITSNHAAECSSSEYGASPLL